MVKVGGVVISTSTPTETILENVRKNLELNLKEVNQSLWWRGAEQIAIVGGGPSLKECLDELRGFKYKIACGSVHDYLVDNNIKFNWCVVCDPDPLTAKYIRKPRKNTTYLIASQCDPGLFEYLRDYNVVRWHLYCGDGKDQNKPLFDHSIYGPGAVPIGGGCTVGTRAMVMAMGMGFFNLHLFGMDTCVNKLNERYSYPLQDKDYEEGLANDFHDIAFEAGGPRFRVLGYQLAQLFDIQVLSHMYANKMFVTVHGDSLLSYFYELAERKLKALKEKENGNSNRPDGVRDVSSPSPSHIDNPDSVHVQRRNSG